MNLLQVVTEVRLSATPEQGGAPVLLHRGHNQLTVGWHETLLRLWQQLAGGQASADRPGSIWFESNADTGAEATAPAYTDTGPDSAHEVFAQYLLRDEDRLATTLDTGLYGQNYGEVPAFQMTCSLSGTTYAGQRLVAAGVYSRGYSGVVPAAGDWTAGDDGVYNVARTLLGPQTLQTGLIYTFNWAWGLVLL